MENSVLQRIKMILQKKNLSITSLSRAIGIPQPTLNRQISGESTMSLNTLDSFLNYLPDISAEWLLRGEGKMEKIIQQIGDIENSSAIGNNVNGNGNQISHNNISDFVEIQKGYQDMIKKKDEHIDRLLSIIEKTTKDL